MVIFEEVEEHAQYTHNFRVDEPLNKSRFDEGATVDEGFPVRKDSLQILEEKGEMKDRYTRKNRHFQTNQLIVLCNSLFDKSLLIFCFCVFVSQIAKSLLQQNQIRLLCGHDW